MTKQIGETRVYTSIDEKTAPSKIQCSICKVFAVPRGITHTGKHGLSKGEEKHCPNCGHIDGRKNH